jgi:hypothetical protein
MVLENYSLNYYRAVSRFISVLKIGEKAYAKWALRALYQNKNYSYCSSKPFYDNAPVDWGSRCRRLAFTCQ